jgi:DNA-binding CsgD family transcriptional regulator
MVNSKRMGSAPAMSDFLLELYHDASEYNATEFRLRVLSNLENFVPFDFAVWGGGRADDRLVTDLTVLNQTEAVLGDWESVASQDAFCDLTLQNLGATARFDDVPSYRRTHAYNEHWRRFDAAHMMATIVADRTGGHVSFVGLCAEKRPAGFTSDERRFKQILMPHLSQAARINRDVWAGRAAMDREAVGLVNADGWVMAEHGAFREFAGHEWGRSIARIPADVMSVLRRGKRWRGETLYARMSPFGKNYFVHLSLASALSKLSRREREVAELFATGLSNKQVALALGTSPSTVRNQIGRIYEKLGISSKAALASAVGRDRL